MRNAILVLILIFAACSDIVPVDTIDLCRGDNPPSNECAQCKKAPFAADCPRCRGTSPDGDCSNAPGHEGGTGSADKGGKGGLGSGGETGGAGGDAVVRDGGGSDTGGTGGDDGSGGTGSPCGTCPSDKPRCNDGECVECRGDGDCGSSAGRCNPDDHSCVQCLDSDDCDGDLGECNTAAHQCVACLADKDCPADDAPQCTGHACGDCTDNDVCKDHGNKKLCDTATSSTTRGECVQCLSHDDCKNPKPQCTSRECTPCTGNAACVRRDGTEVCNTREDVATSGECVECTGPTEAAKCGVKSCKQSTGKCTDTDQDSLVPCNKKCEADSECRSGSRCVVQPNGDDGETLGPYCFLVKDEDCADTNEQARPYSVTDSLTSVDGKTSEYCLPVTSCQAFMDATDYMSAGPRPCTDNGDCGEGTGDGYCIASNHPMAPNKCSYGCDNNYECPSTGFTSCSGSGSNKFCQPPP